MFPPPFWAHDSKPAPAGLEILKLHQSPCRKIVLLTPFADHVVAPQRIHKTERVPSADEQRVGPFDGRDRAAGQIVYRLEGIAHRLESCPRFRRVAVAIEERIRHEQHAADGRAEERGDRIGAMIEVPAAVERRIADEQQPHGRKGSIEVGVPECRQSSGVS